MGKAKEDGNEGVGWPLMPHSSAWTKEFCPWTKNFCPGQNFKA